MRAEKKWQPEESTYRSPAMVLIGETGSRRREGTGIRKRWESIYGYSARGSLYQAVILARLHYTESTHRFNLLTDRPSRYLLCNTIPAFPFSVPLQVGCK